MNNIQLFDLMPADFSLPHHVTFKGVVKPVSAENLPFMYWPDGVPSVEANAYMISLMRRGLSRRTRGGTIRQYALNISPLLRFCSRNRLNLSELNDNLFTLFIKGMQVKNKLGQQQRNSNEVIKIGRQCIDFLRFLAIYLDNEKLIGTKDCAITITESTHTIKRGNGKKSITVTTWHHEAFPSPDPVSKRHPISNVVVEKLKKAVNLVSDRGLRKRKALNIACYEQTGGRRTEVANLLVKDIEAAYNSKEKAPMLRILTLKSKPNTFRYVPVPRAFIELALDYIKFTRQRIIRNTIGTANDHGYLFINHRNGKKLADNTFTNEISELCKLAGVMEQAHPHLFRHAYITQKLKAIILQHDIANKDEFRKALLNIESFKMQLQEWTGHSDIGSLDVYIDLAFSDLSSMNVAINAVMLGSAVDVARDHLMSLQSDVKAKAVTVTQLFNELESILDALQDDIERSMEQHAFQAS